jgi:hypothetical protein
MKKNNFEYNVKVVETLQRYGFSPELNLLAGSVTLPIEDAASILKLIETTLKKAPQ